jgi:hypothetical protein
MPDCDLAVHYALSMNTHESHMPLRLTYICCSKFVQCEQCTQGWRSCIPQDKVHELGPWGPALFVVTVVGCEMIPLFPTQPLALASGLLFGPVEVDFQAYDACPHAKSHSPESSTRRSNAATCSLIVVI